MPGCPIDADVRQHQTMKNRILLENYYLPGDLEASICAFVNRYNHNHRRDIFKQYRSAALAEWRHLAA